MIHYVYTEKAEAKAASHGLEPRPANSPAFFGFTLMTDGPTARDWLKRGYIQEAGRATPPEVLCFPVEDWPGNVTPAGLIRDFSKRAGLAYRYCFGSILLAYLGSEYAYSHIERHGSYYTVHLPRR